VYDVHQSASQETEEELADIVQQLQGFVGRLKSKHRQTTSQLQLEKEQEREELSQQIRHLTEEQTRLQTQIRQQRDELSRLQTRCETAEEALHEKEKQLGEYLDVLDIRPEELHLTDKQLGSGSFGAVHVGFWCGIDVAVKTFHESLRLPQLAPYFMRELSISSQLHHPNVVPICGAVMENGIPIQIVMELLQGSLSDLMKAARASRKYLGYLSFREQIDVAGDIASAIMYMHRLRPKPYVHCDIRSTNVMITSTMVAKVGDLGASHVIDSTHSMGALSPEYVAPERQPGADGMSSRSSCQSDIYSLGVTLIELFTGLVPVPSDRKNQLLCINNEDLQEMCKRMIRDKPGDRLPAEECQGILMRQKTTSDLYKMLPGKRIVRGNLEGETMNIVDV
jgi:hypothetical protein